MLKDTGQIKVGTVFDRRCRHGALQGIECHIEGLVVTKHAPVTPPDAAVLGMPLDGALGHRDTFAITPAERENFAQTQPDFDTLGRVLETEGEMLQREWEFPLQARDGTHLEAYIGIVGSSW